MNNSMFFTICSLFYSILLICIFFSKKRINLFENKIYSGNLFSSCKIWLAQYRNTEYTYGGRVNMWQYTSKGRVDGINGDVDISAWVY